MKFKLSDIRKLVKESIGETKIDKKYTHFAINKKTNKIVSGWDYNKLDNESIKYYTKMDLTDQFPDVKISEFKVITKNKMEFDPFDANNWGT